MKVEELKELRTGAELTNALPAIELEIATALNAVVNSVATLISQNALTPELALTKWLEYHAAVKLRTKFRNRAGVVNNINTKLLDF